MERTRHDVDQLFSLVDEAIDEAPHLARTALEAILMFRPDLGRARELITLAQADRIERDPLLLVMEAAEDLAARGLHIQAREVAAYVRKRYAAREEARAWLEGVDLLLES